MPLLKGKSNKTISKNIKTILSEKGKNTNQKQAVAIALSVAKKARMENSKKDKKMDKGKEMKVEKKEYKNKKK